MLQFREQHQRGASAAADRVLRSSSLEIGKRTGAKACYINSGGKFSATLCRGLGRALGFPIARIVLGAQRQSSGAGLLEKRASGCRAPVFQRWLPPWMWAILANMERVRALYAHVAARSANN